MAKAVMGLFVNTSTQMWRRLHFNEYPVDKAIEKSASLAIYASKKKVQKFVHYIKMFVMPDAQAETIEKAVKPMVDENAKIVADGARSHYQLKDVFREVEMHQETMEGVKEVVNKNLPWVHIVAGDCRNGIAAIHKEVDERFLQLYLNEYCWKFNRRCFRDAKGEGLDLFDHLIRIAAQYTSDIRWRDYSQVIHNDI